jgi:hypothetical protein
MEFVKHINEIVSNFMRSNERDPQKAGDSTSQICICNECGLSLLNFYDDAKKDECCRKEYYEEHYSEDIFI